MLRLDKLDLSELEISTQVILYDSTNISGHTVFGGARQAACGERAILGLGEARLAATTCGRGSHNFHQMCVVGHPSQFSENSSSMLVPLLCPCQCPNHTCQRNVERRECLHGYVVPSSTPRPSCTRRPIARLELQSSKSPPLLLASSTSLPPSCFKGRPRTRHAPSHAANELIIFPFSRDPQRLSPRLEHHHRWYVPRR